MRYIRAQDILPEELLNQLQRYVDGVYLYIPRAKENRLDWASGQGVEELAKAYFLTEKTIRRILLEERRLAKGSEKDT